VLPVPLADEVAVVPDPPEDDPVALPEPPGPDVPEQPPTARSAATTTAARTLRDNVTSAPGDREE
jgi:hypothetical protein